MERVTHQGRTTAYRSSDRGGDGAPLLCVHGAGGESRSWKGQFRLSDDRPVHALDLSGHGESDDINADPGYGTFSAYTDDVLAVADETGAEVFVGSSMGGAVLMHAALDRSEFTPRALVFAGTGARMPVLDDLLAWLDDDFDRAIDFLTAPDRLFHDPNEELVDVVETTFRETGQAVVRRDFLSCHDHDVRDSLGEIDVPALAVVGEHDQLTPPWYHEQLADDLPDCEYAEIPDAGHLAMLERPAAFDEVLDGFLTSLE